MAGEGIYFKKDVDFGMSEYVETILPARGKIVEEQVNGRFGETVWTLSNGMKVAYKRTDPRGQYIYMSAISKMSDSK